MDYAIVLSNGSQFVSPETAKIVDGNASSHCALQIVMFFSPYLFSLIGCKKRCPLVPSSEAPR